MYHLNVSYYTDVGDIKKTNQDSLLVRHDKINGHDVGLFIVADGCGGLAFGEEVSNLIVMRFSRIWEDELVRVIGSGKADLLLLDEYLSHCLEGINAEALSFGQQVEGRVGSTISLLLTVDGQYILKNVGDSRIYLKRGGKISRLTEDQSLVADMIRGGKLTEDEAKHYGKKNVLTMCVGYFAELRVFSGLGRIKRNDVFLLCCDGLHNSLSAEEMLAVLNDKAVPFEQKAEKMRQLIPHGKARDNVSAVICEFVGRGHWWQIF